MNDIPAHITITTDDDYTHVIILNTAMPQLPANFPTENVLGLAHEPSPFLGLTEEFVAYARKYIGKYLIGDLQTATALGAPFAPYYGFLWHNPSPALFFYPFEKPKRMSMVVSQKNSAPGHKYRHQLLQKILQTNWPVDIYGRCVMYYNRLNDPRIKGTFEQGSDEPYRDYQFHICIENFCLPWYISEKLTNCFLYETTPIYFGAESADKLFPNMCLRLTGDIGKDMQLLQDILREPAKYQAHVRTDVEQAKKQMNVFEYLS